jgi:signal transduction histidine kinase
LGPWARIALAGVLAAAALAIGLGVYIPREVERRFLEAQVDADRREVQTLTGTSQLVDPANPDFESLGRLTEEAIARGDYLRVKIWAPDGTIIYSDESTLIGQAFPIEDDLATAFATGVQQTEISDLTVSENVLERDLADRLIETYVPVERDGSVIAVWEVYHSLDRLDEAVRGVKTVVWASVGSGLSLLALFLVSAFGNLVAELQRRRKEAEARTEELSAFLAIARTMANTTDAEAAAAEAVDIVYRTGGYEAVGLYRTGDGEGMPVLIAAAGTSRWLDEHQLENRRDDASAESGMVALRAVVALGADPRSDLLRGAVEEAHLGIDRAKLMRDLEVSEGRLRVVMEKLLSAQEEERMRIVGEVHDGIGQDLHRVLFGIRGCLNATDEERTAELGRLDAIIDEASRRLRRLLRDLHPTVIEDVGLAASLRSLVGQLSEEGPAWVEIEMGDFDEPVIETRLAVFRVAQEALRNALKHAPGAQISLSLHQQDDSLVLLVTDTGRGFSPGSHNTGLGLWLMEERAGAVGGTLQISSDESGTKVTAVFPRGSNV